MDKIIVFANPVALFQKIMVVQDGETKEAGVRVNDLADVVFDSAIKCGLKDIEFYGNKEYCLGLMRQLCNHSQYSTNFTIKHIGG